MPATPTDRGKWKGDATRGLLFQGEDEDEDEAEDSPGGRGSLHSTPDHRRSGALGWRAVKRCLANKTVVFVGDSNMRYQYLALAQYLHTGRWDTWPRSGLPKKRFSVCNENSYPYITVNGTLVRAKNPTDPLKWAGYFEGGVEALGHNELCECRKDLEMENRWYSEGELRMGFAWFTSMASQNSLMRSWPAWDGVAGKCRRADCSHTSPRPPKSRVRALNASSFVEQRLAPLRPSAVLFGPGAWVQGSRDDAAFMSDLRLTMGRIKHAVGRSGHAIFRTCLRGQHTHRRGGLGCGNTAGCDEPYRAVAREADWGVLDAQLMTDALHEFSLDNQRAKQRTLLEKKQQRSSPGRSPDAFPTYLDPMHVSCDVYRELNLRLLSRLCPAGETHTHRERRTGVAVRLQKDVAARKAAKAKAVRR